MQGDQDRTSDAGEWGELAESFFERGDALSVAEDPASGPAGHDEETETKPSARVHAVLQAWILTRTIALRSALGSNLGANLRSNLRSMMVAVRHPRVVHVGRILMFSAAVNHCVVCVMAATFGA